MSSSSIPAAAGLDARLATLERRGRALTLAVALLAPTTATLALAAFRRPAPQPQPTLEGERLVLRAADGHGPTVVIEPTDGGGVRVLASQVTELKVANTATGRMEKVMQGAELAVTPSFGSPSLELRDAGGRTVARLGGPQARPATP